MSNEQLHRNLDLLHEAVLAIVDHEETRSVADDLAKQGVFVLIDSTDVELAAHNHAMADAAERSGMPIVRLELQKAPTFVIR